MSNKLKCFSGHGIGDAIMGGIRVADKAAIVLGYENVECSLFVRDEVFEPIKLLYIPNLDILKIEQHCQKEFYGENNLVLEKWNEVTLNEEFNYTYNVPDLLFRNPHALDLKDLELFPNEIKQHRLLSHVSRATERVIYLALNTSTPEYYFPNKQKFIDLLAAKLPDYTIYFNNITKWNNQDTNNEKLTNLAPNVAYFENQSFDESLEWLKGSCYCVCLDNGVSHVSWDLGLERVFLSTRLNKNGVSWISRWYETLDDVIDQNTPIEKIVDLIETNLRVPETKMLSRNAVLSILNENHNPDWKRLLYFKY